MLSNLEVGNCVEFSTLSQSQLSNKKFTICKINKYKFENATNTAFKIKCDSEIFYISDTQGEEDQITISRIMKEEELCKFFDLKEFSLIFSNNLDLKIHSKNIAGGPLHYWVEPLYTKDFDYVQGTYYHDNNLKSGDKFYYYTISAQNSSIDVEVFDSGKILFYVTIYLVKSSITIK